MVTVNMWISCKGLNYLPASEVTLAKFSSTLRTQHLNFFSYNNSTSDYANKVDRQTELLLNVYTLICTSVNFSIFISVCQSPAILNLFIYLFFLVISVYLSICLYAYLSYIWIICFIWWRRGGGIAVVIVASPPPPPEYVSAVSCNLTVTGIIIVSWFFFLSIFQLTLTLIFSWLWAQPLNNIYGIVWVYLEKLKLQN